MTRWLLVGVGGFTGTLLRYGMGGAVQRLFPSATFPFGTLAVNLAGCLCIGCLAGLSDSRELFGADTRAFLFIGVLGGFTTFSSFGYETFALMRDGDGLRALTNVAVHVVLGLACVWLGYALGSWR